MDKAWYDRRVLGGRVLSGSIDVEIPQTYGFEPIEFEKNPAVIFSREL
jgi:hypothetical protein